MEWLLKHVETFVLTHGLDKTYWVGLSGGLDSQVLLHLCAKLRQTRPLILRAIHINHGLHPEAPAWAAHCAEICHHLNVPLSQEKITVLQGTNESPEARARQGRYQAILKKLDAHSILLTAHHQDDQAETVLLQLLRGAGPKGLAGMPSIKPLGPAQQGRPLLNVSRNDLQHYATQQQLIWSHDASNDDVRYTRNFLRHEILPLLKKRWPTVQEALTRVAENCAETQLALESTLAADLQHIRLSDAVLSLKKLLLLAPVRQRHLLRYWFKCLGFKVPSAIKLRQLQQDFFQASADKLPYMVWDNVEVRRYQDRLYIMPQMQPHDRFFSTEWDFIRPLSLPPLGNLHASLQSGRGLKIEIKKARVCFRQGGERCQLPGRHFHHDLKKLFQIWNVPPWERDRVPLIFIDDRLVAVVGYFIDPQFQAGPNELGHCFTLSPKIDGKCTNI